VVSGAEIIASLAALLGASATSLAAWLAQRLQRNRGVAPSVPQVSLEERLDELSLSMRRSARLVEQVSAELEARAASARQLQEDAKTAEAVAAFHKEQTEAVRRMLDAELVTQAKGIRRDSVWIGVVSFVGGGLLTLAVTLFVH
jgi:hypothetical protein